MRLEDFTMTSISPRIATEGTEGTDDKSRDFVKTLSANRCRALRKRLVGDLIAQSPKARVMDSRFKGMSERGMNEAKRLGCLRRHSLHAQCHR